MQTKLRFKLFFWYFCHFKVVLLGYLKPRLVLLNDQEAIVCLPLKRRSRNHLHSMYFGALAAGADLAGGLHGFYHAEKSQTKISLVFKSFQAQFLRRAEADVYFICQEGEVVKGMIEETKLTSERVTKTLTIHAYTHYPQQPDKIAEFKLELSLKKA